MRKLMMILPIVMGVFPNGLSAQSCADSLNIYTYFYQGRKYEIVKELKS